MRRSLIAALLALATVASTAGVAQGRTFDVVVQTGNVALPSADAPNLPGSVSIPLAIMRPPTTRQELSFEDLVSTWKLAGAEYGVPWQVLGAINQIESNFGRGMRVSSAGAVGWMQFLPSTWLRWGVDANGDGLADPWNAIDAIYSAARYLAASGADKNVKRAIFSYNHAASYVDDVLKLARVFNP
ncbi:MAG: lytic transglycosylase domain-containing protein, partial [Gaiellales bacterium]